MGCNATIRNTIQSRSVRLLVEFPSENYRNRFNEESDFNVSVF